MRPQGAFVVMVRYFKIPTLFTRKLPVKFDVTNGIMSLTIEYLSDLQAFLWGLVFALIVHLRSLKVSLKKMRYTCPVILASVLDLRDGNTSAAKSVTRCWKIKGRPCMLKLIQKVWRRFNPRNVRPVCHDAASPPLPLLFPGHGLKFDHIFSLARELEHHGERRNGPTKINCLDDIFIVRARKWDDVRSEIPITLSPWNYIKKIEVKNPLDFKLFEP